MALYADTHFLRSSGRNIAVPFRAKVDIEGRTSELICTQVLRVLPGKRLVCFGEWDQKPIVVKFFFDARRAKRHCTREEEGIRAFGEAGIKAPQLLFRGVMVPGGTPVLGLQRISPARDLGEAWEHAENDDRRGRLLNSAVAVIADQHAAGLSQADPFRKNFLLSGDIVFSIDGDGVVIRKKGRPLSTSLSLQSLGHFLAQFYPRYNHLFEDAFGVYAQRRKWARQVSFQSLMRHVKSQFNRRKKIRLKKVYRESTALVCKKSWRHFILCDRECHSPAMSAFLADPDKVMEQGRILKAGNTATVAMIHIDDRTLVVKRYNIKNLKHGLRRCLRKTRAWTSWRNANFLKLLFLHTARPIALRENRWGFLRFKAYYISECLEGDDFKRLFHSNKLDTDHQTEIIMQLGKMLQSMADASVSHGDFKATNFIAGKNGLSVIDLDVLRQHRWRWRFRRAFRRDCRRLMKNWKDLPHVAALFKEMLLTVKF